MGKLLKPDESLKKITDIDLDRLKQKGIKGLILDLDNTVVPWGEDTPNKEIIDFVKMAKKEGFRLCLISNAQKHRVSTCGDILEIPGIGFAKKPFPGSLRKAQKELLKLSPKEVAIVGDQIFTDILGGNMMGFYTILVKPITKKDFIGTKVFRFLERLLDLR